MASNETRASRAVRADLAGRGPLIREIVSLHRASNPRIFGSVARGDSLPGADIDVLVDYDDDASFLDEVSLRLALAEALAARVDVVASDAIRGSVRRRILDESIPV